MQPHFRFSVMDKINYLTPLSIKIENSEIGLAQSFMNTDSASIMFFRLRAMGFISDTTPNQSSGDNAFSGDMVATDGSTLSITSENLDPEEDGYVLTPSITVTVPSMGGTAGGSFTYSAIKLGDDDDNWFPQQENSVYITNPLFAMPTVEKWYEDYPPHHKAMMFANWGISGHDFFADHRFRRIIAETAMNVFKIQCIVGFDTSVNGMEN